MIWKAVYQLFADAEIVAFHSRLRFHAPTSDVSLLGCYINSVNWLPAGSEIRLRIMHKGAIVIAGGRVVRSGPAKGLGVEFTFVGSDQKAILKDWLAAARWASSEHVIVFHRIKAGSSF